MPGARTLRCAAHRSVRSTGGLAPPARACSGVTRRPFGWWPDWLAGFSQGLCRYASRACSGSASPDEFSSREELTARSGHLAGRQGPMQQTNAGRGAAERAGWVLLHGRPHQLRTGHLVVLDRHGDASRAAHQARLRRQHGSFSKASGIWLAGRCETPPQHAPAARTSKG